MRTLLISTYDLGRQPLGLASPMAWLRRAGMDVRAVDTSREPLLDEDISSSGLIAFFLPMHTATRLAAPLIERAKMINPRAELAAYGLYAPLNATWLRDRGVLHVLAPDAASELVSLATLVASGLSRKPQTTGLSRKPQTTGLSRKPQTTGLSRKPQTDRAFIQPDRSSLLPLERYARLQMPDGTRRVVGNTEATQGCKHLCRHCPIVPVYQGTFRALPLDVVLEDIRVQVAQGAQHITFGDPDFFNGPTHARRLVERLSRDFPGLTYDVTVKIEHLLKHADMLKLLRETGCLFITSAVESVDDVVLEKLRKGHTRADFVRAVALCRETGVTLAPTFVAFTPWTSLEGYADLLDQIEALGLVHEVAPIQLAIRLLITAESKLLELPDVRAVVDPFDAQSLTWPWRHHDGRVDALQRDVMRIVSESSHASRAETFAAISACVDAVGPVLLDRPGTSKRTRPTSERDEPRPAPPHLTEAWYCCAEPLDHLQI